MRVELPLSPLTPLEFDGIESSPDMPPVFAPVPLVVTPAPLAPLAPFTFMSPPLVVLPGAKSGLGMPAAVAGDDASRSSMFWVELLPAAGGMSAGDMFEGMGDDCIVVDGVIVDGTGNVPVLTPVPFCAHAAETVRIENRARPQDFSVS